VIVLTCLWGSFWWGNEWQSLALATALDQEKGVEGGITRILEIPALVTEFEKRIITYKLDLIQAYLRRVHFFVYYGGDEFTDEGDLLFGQVRLSLSC